MVRVSSLWSRSERAAVERIEVLLEPKAAAEYRAWAARAAALSETPAQLVQFAPWYPPAERAWLEQAAAAGVWIAAEPDAMDREYCRAPVEALGHTRRADGLVLHFVAAEDGGAVALRARYCRVATIYQTEIRWTDDRRLSWEELEAGTPCKGCGRSLFGTFEHRPILQRTPEEAELHDAEEAAFRALHPNCHASRWSHGSTGLTHCSACCPPPPLGPEQSREIARILVGATRSAAERDVELARRWEATAPTAPVAAVTAAEQLRLWPRGRAVR